MVKVMLKLQFPSFYPPETSLAPEGKPATPKTADDINDLFKELDNEPEKEVKKSKEDKENKEDKEDKGGAEGDDDDELELKEPDEEVEKLDLKDDENLDIEAPPRKKEILKEFPEIFKKFPFLEKMIYRDREYTELFGSFDDAKEIAERSEIFSSFENQLLAGSTEEILKNVKEVDEKAFNKIIDDYLPTLAKVDKEAYLHVTGNLNKRLIMEMVQEAKDNDDEDLKQAALIVNRFVFGTAKFTPPANRSVKADSTEQSEVEEERLSFVKERFESARDDLQTQVDNTLRATITDYIDPKGVMSAYVKKNAVADAMKILVKSIADDPSVPKNLGNLWRTATDNKFSNDSLKRIKSFYLSKAKGNLKNAILKARAEALKDSKPRQEKETDDIEEETPRKRIIPTGRPSTPKSKNGMNKGESVTDFFMRD